MVAVDLVLAQELEVEVEYSNLWPYEEFSCITDIISDPPSIDDLINLHNNRKFVRESMHNIENLFNRNTLYIPVVFHNIYKIENGEPVASYCDYNGGFSTTNFQYTTGNNQAICNQRMLRSLQVLNANYAPANIEFVLHPDYPEMLHATDPGFDGFYERATGGTETWPSAYDLKEHYNISNALNIYAVDFVNTRDGTLGISTYPWSYGILGGIFIKFGQLPGDVDVQYQADYGSVLMHEVGHYFSLLHINGVWYLMEGNTPRGLVSGDDCNEHGDLICDTPAEPGMSNNAWYTNNSSRECIYYGYGGEYNPDDSILKIGGYNQTYFSGYYPFYNYCEEWGIEDAYDLDHCQLFTNYDNVGDFFGTKNVDENCYNENQSDIATDCHLNNYPNLPIGYNFMRAGSFPYNSCGISPIDDNIYYDESKQGFTPEQFENIRYSVETDYTGCPEEQDDFSEYYLINECIECSDIIGELNYDSIVDIFDIIIMVDCVISGDCDTCSDINSDGITDIFDINLLVDIILNL